MRKLFTHTDLDGIGCAILAKLVFGDNIDISYCNYDDINLEVEKFFYDIPQGFEYAYITDISINDDLAQRLDKSELGKYITLLDHHHTAEYLNKYSWCNVFEYQTNDSVGSSMKTCSTELYYNYLVDHGFLERSDTSDVFVSTVRDYDTWRWKELGDEGILAKQLNDLLYIYGRDEFIDAYIAKIKSEFIYPFNEFEVMLLTNRQKDIDAYIEKKNKQLYVTEFISYDRRLSCGVVFAETYFSELGNKLSELHPELDFISMIDISSGKISYRTVKDDLDLGKEVARLLGGGGHPKASGSTFSNDISHELIKQLLAPPQTEKPTPVHPHQKCVDYVKICADSIKENAESIVGTEKTLKDVLVTIRLYPEELPEINIDRNFYPEGIFK